MPFRCDPVQTSFWDFSKESVSTQQTDKTRDAFHGPPLCFFGFGFRVEQHAELSVSKATNDEFTMHDGFKEFCFIGCDRTKRAITAPLATDRFTDRIEHVRGRVFVADDRKCLQITCIGGAGDFDTTVYVSHAFAHGNPRLDALAIADDLAVDLEASWVVNGRLDPQYTTIFVVHFDRVLFNPVSDANTFNSLFDIAGELAGETRIGTAAEETHHILGTEVFNGMAREKWINRSEAGGIFEDNIGGIFPLSNGPVVWMQIQAGAWPQKRVKAQSELIEKVAPFAAEHFVGHFLYRLWIFDMQETVFTALIADTGFVHCARKPLPAVHTDLDRARKPTLKSNMHESELSVNEVEVEMETFPFSWDELQLLGLPVLADGVREAWLDTREHADQTGGDAVLCHYLSGNLILGYTWGSNILQGSTVTESILLGVLFDHTRLAVNKLTEVFEQNMIDTEKRFHSLQVADRPERTPKDHPIEPAQNVINRISMAMNELFHGVLLHMVCWISKRYQENAWNIKHFLYNPWFHPSLALVAASLRCVDLCPLILTAETMNG